MSGDGGMGGFQQHRFGGGAAGGYSGWYDDNGHWHPHLTLEQRIERLEFHIGLGVLYLAGKLDELIDQEAQEVSDLTQLTADVAAVQGTANSAIVAIQGLKAALDAAGTDPTALANLSASLESTTNDLAAAIAANPVPTDPAGGGTTEPPPPSPDNPPADVPPADGSTNPDGSPATGADVPPGV